MSEEPSVRRALIDAALVLGVTFVANLLLLLVPTVGMIWSLQSLASAPLTMIESSWTIWLTYAALLTVIAVAAWGMKRSRRAWLAVPAAVVAWPIGQMLRAVVVGGDPLVFLLFGVTGFFGLVAASVAAALLVPRLFARRQAAAGADETESPVAPRERRWAGTAAGLTLAGSVLLIATFPMQWFEAYFALFGADREASPEQAFRYLVTFIAALALGVASFVFFFLARRQARAIGSTIVIAVVVLVGVVCWVPRLNLPIAPATEVVDEGGSGNSECAWDASRPGCGG